MVFLGKYKALDLFVGSRHIFWGGVKMKRILPVTVLMALTILSATSACAQEGVVTMDFDKSVGIADKRMKRDTYYGPKQEDFSGGSTVTYHVNIPKDHGWGKLYVRNDGKADMALTFDRISDNKQVVLEGSNPSSTGVVTIAPGKAQIIYTEKPTGTGNHSIQINSGEAKLEGTVTYKYSNDKNNL